MPFLLSTLAPLAACSGAADKQAPVEDPSVTAMRAQLSGKDQAIAKARALAIPKVAGAPGAISANGVMNVELTGTPELQPLDNVVAVDLGPTQSICTFDYQGGTLLMAGAEPASNARGRGAIKVAGLQRGLDGAAAAGQQYIEAGPSMGDGQVSIELRRGRGAGQPGEGGTTLWPAEMVVRYAAGSERTYAPGTWTCGI